MKRLSIVSAVVLLIGFLVSLGCTQVNNRATTRSSGSSRPVAYALAVNVKGGLQPSPVQWAAIQAKFAAELAASGCILVTDLSLADRILRVDFVPNPNDPEDSGRAVIVSVRDNPLQQLTLVPSLAVTSSSRYPSSFGYSGTFLNSFSGYPYSSYYGYGNSFSSYYGYGNSYYDGYSYSSPTLNPQQPTPTPPTKHHPNPDHNPDHRHHRGPGDPDNRCPPLLAAAPILPAASAMVAYPPSDGSLSKFHNELSRSNRDWSYSRVDRGDNSSRTYARSDSGSSSSSSDRSSSTAASADHSRSWVSRLFSLSDSGSSNSSSSSSRSSYSGDRSYSNYDRSSQSSYYRTDPAYSRSDSSYSSSGSSYSSSSYSSSSYSPPSSSSSSYSAPAAAAAPASSSSSMASAISSAASTTQTPP